MHGSPQNGGAKGHTGSPPPGPLNVNLRSRPLTHGQTSTDRPGFLTGQGLTCADPTTGKLETIVDPAMRTTTVTIDGSGDLTVAELPDGSMVSFVYDSDHRLITKVDPRGVAWHYDYGL